MEDKTSVILRSIGLNKNEVKIYLDLVRQDFSTALEISRRTNIHRSNTYDSLRGLIEKGFVNERTENSKRLFCAVDPLKLQDYMQQKEQEINSIIPHLKHLSLKGDRTDNVVLSKGEFALKSMLSSLLELDKPIFSYGLSEKYLNTLGVGFLEDFYRKACDKRIFIRQIYNISAFSDTFKDFYNNKYFDVRHLAKKYDSLVSTHICGEKVVIVVFSDIPSIIEIDSKDIANSYSQYFELLWNNSKSK